MCQEKTSGPSKRDEAQAAAGRVEAVMLVLAVGVEDQPGGARLVVELDGDAGLEGHLRRRPSSTGTASGRRSRCPCPRRGCGRRAAASGRRTASSTRRRRGRRWSASGPSGWGSASASSGLRALTGTAKPRFSVTADLRVTMPCTRPCMSSSGPPLLPGSTGMASWIIERPSMSRRAETTPAATLYSRPRGLPSDDDLAPLLDVVGVAQFQGRQVLRVDADDGQVGAAVGGVDVRWPRSCLPSEVCTVMGRASPMTCMLVAISPSADDEAGADALRLAVAAGGQDHHDRLARRRRRVARWSSACRRRGGGWGGGGRGRAGGSAGTA